MRGLGQPNINRVEYFFNTDPGFGLANPIPVPPGVNIPNLSVNLPLAGLAPGLNTLFIRSANTNNVWNNKPRTNGACFESGGKRVLTQQIMNYTTIINFSSHANGMYYLVAEKEGKPVYTKKILKQ